MEHLKLAEQHSRGLSYRRDIRNRKIHHRKTICTKYYGWDWYKHDGQYSKGKIHCSCGLCKPGRKWDLPQLKDYKDKEVVESALSDYYNN